MIENAQTQMRKGILEYCILSIIAHKAMYASTIIEKLREAKLIIVEGTLYPLLTRLQKNGALEYSWVESGTGHPRKYYRLSDQGKETLEQLHITWNELAFAVKSAIG